MHTLAMVMVYNIIFNETISTICLQLLDGVEVRIGQFMRVCHARLLVPQFCSQHLVWAASVGLGILPTWSAVVYALM
jgi:hypothetical protein